MRTAIALGLVTLGASAPQELDFPRAERDIVRSFPVEKAWTVEDLLTAYARATDQALVYDARSLKQARSTDLGIDAPLSIPASAVHETVEALIARNGLILRVVHAESPRILGVTHPHRPDWITREMGSAVTAAELAGVAGHEALSVHTVVTLENLDVYEGTRAIRESIEKDDRVEIVVLSSTPCVVVKGLARRVSEVAKALREVDRQAAK